MSKTTIFIQVHGRPDVLEAELAEGVTLEALRAALTKAGVTIDEESFIFLDDAEEHLHGDHNQPVHGLKRGCRIHVCRCRRITATVNYLDKTAEHTFPPGARLRAVKAWAVHKFGLDPKDATEHVLQVCKSSDRPPNDTPLHRLVQGHYCETCFDLVPEKRVEG